MKMHSARLLDPPAPSHRASSERRRGRISMQLVVIFGSLVVLGLLIASLFVPASPRPSSGDRPKQPLVVYCAASNKSVMEAIRSDYEAKYAIPLQIQYGPSQTLLASIQV